MSNNFGTTSYYNPINNKTINHSSSIPGCIGQLFESQQFSDLTICVENEEFKVHRVILAARSEYFRGLLFGGLKESHENIIHLKEINSEAFRLLLRYLYTGIMVLSDIREDVLLHLLGLAHQYRIPSLEVAISSNVQENLNLDNVCSICNMANLFADKALLEACYNFMSLHAENILNCNGFLTLSSAVLKNILNCDSFFCDELEILRAVQRWAQARNLIDNNDDSGSSVNGGQNNSEWDNISTTSNSNWWDLQDPELKAVLSAVRLPLISLKDLLGEVRKCNLISPDNLLDVITQKYEGHIPSLAYRGILMPEVNMATKERGARIESGEKLGDAFVEEPYDVDRGFVQHCIDDKSSCIIICLGRPTIINTVKMLLWDKDARSYSYALDVCTCDSEWIRVVDHSQYFCRSWQQLHFDARVVQKLRIVGTDNTANRHLHVVQFKCYFTKRKFALYQGLLVALRNVATPSHSAFVREGVSRTSDSLINGDTKNYDWEYGYTCHQLGNGGIVVQLSQPYWINSVRFLLWDLDNRTYSYTVEVSVKMKDWQMVCDRSEEECRSWQTVEFPARPVCFIRITGTHNSVNEVFHIVHFECPVNFQSLLESCGGCIDGGACVNDGVDDETLTTQ